MGAMMPQLLFTLCLLLFLGSASAQSFMFAHGGGHSVINLGINGQGGYEFLNLVKNCHDMQASTYAYPSILDSNGYPQSTPSTMIYCVVSPLAMPDNPTMVMKFSGAMNVAITGAFTVSSDPGSCVQGSTAFSLNLKGTNCRVEFTFTTAVAGFNVQFLTTGTYTSPSNLVVVRKDQETNLTNGKIFNTDFLKVITALNPRVVRFLDWAQISPSNNLSKSGYKAPIASLTYASPSYPTGAWGGTISGTDTYTGANQPDASCLTSNCGYADGETYIGFVQNANTISTPTLNVGGRGAVTIQNLGAGTVGGAISANAPCAFVYDAALNVWLERSGGLLTQVPIEIQIALCNAVNKDCWLQIPSLFDQASSDAYVAVARDNLNFNLNLYLEYSNEMWSFGNSQTGWANSRGAALGWPNSNQERELGFYAMRVCTFMKSALTTWTASRPASQLHRVMTTQTSINSTNAETYLFEGHDINPSLYASVPVDCHTAPNRPVDQVEILSMAPYVNGAQMTDMQAHYANTMTDAVTAADNYASGNPASMASALAWMDSDTRTGTRNGSAGTATLLWFSGTIFPQWQTFGALYGKEITQYEGGYQTIAPTAATLTGLGLTSSSICGTAACLATEFENLLEGYKNSGLFAQLVYDHFHNFMAGANSKYPAWYFLLRDETIPNQWAIYPSDIYSTPFKSQIGIANFNGTLP